MGIHWILIIDQHHSDMKYLLLIVLFAVLGPLASAVAATEEATSDCPPGCPPGCVPVTEADLPEAVRVSFAALVEPTAVTGYRSAVFAEKTVYVALVSVDGATKAVALDATGQPVVTVAVCPHCGGHHGPAAHDAPASDE